VNIYFFKEFETLECFAAGPQGLGIKNTTFLDLYFPADDIVTGSGVAADADPVDIDQFALVNLNGDINPSATLGLIDVGADIGKCITVFGVIISYFEDIIA